MQSITLERRQAWHPMHAMPPVAAAPIESSGSSVKPRTARPVLVVDDDVAIRSMVREALTDEGIAVVEASDGSQALAILDSVAPCLILLDMRMPGMDGWSFARAYRARTGPRAPVVVITAARDARGWANEIAADGVLPKPFDLIELIETVERFC